MTITTARAQVPGTLISDYFLRTVPRPRELIILLHGYALTGKIVFDKLASVCPSDAIILAPNGPFPLPERKADGAYRVGFSWYFYNSGMDDYFIDMRVSLELLTGLVHQLGFGELPKRFIGFSQGGYLAPFAAIGMSHVRQVVGVGSEFLPDEIGAALEAAGLSWPPVFRMDSVHGVKDDVVPIADAQKGHDGVLAHGTRGELIPLAEEGHRLSKVIIESVGLALGKLQDPRPPSG